MSENVKDIFIHLPKTGGTTLRLIIGRNYHPRLTYTIDGAPGSVEAFINLPPERRREFVVLQGHIPFGLHEHLGGEARYVTMLRHPVERVVSLYYYVRKIPAHPFHDAARRMTLAEFVEGGTEQAVNHQTRLLAGREDDFTDAALADAIENLSRFAAVGLVERFDESLVLFRKILGWRRIHYVKGNVTKGRPAREEIPTTTVRIIEERNAFDMELYRFASARFDEILARAGTALVDEARAFRRTNRIYGGFAACYRAARLVAPAPLRDAVRKAVRG